MSENPSCYRCNGASVKSGSVKGKQRWTCKECGLRFTRTSPPGKPLVTKLDAVCLYLKGLSFRAIAHLKGVSDVAVLGWVKQFAKDNYQKPEPGSVVVLELDEMWHFIQKNSKNAGYGKCLIVTVEDSLTGKSETALLKH
jgi:transposase-like protein